MNEAPETIWAWDYEDVETGITHNTVSAHNPTPILATEYRRADLPPTPEQIMAGKRVNAAFEACRIIDEVVKHGHENTGEMILHFLTAAEPARLAMGGTYDT